MKRNEYLKSGIVLSSICIILALILGGVNLLTAPTIEENEFKATQAALLDVYPGAEDFKSVDLLNFENIPQTVTEAYSANDGGYVVKIKTTGYKSDMILIFGISSDFKVVGAKCLSSNETLSAEKTYGNNLVGKNLEELDKVDTISGATKTTAAYKNAAKDAVGAVMIFAGGSYDARSDYEIKRDGALPAANGEFEVLFFAEDIDNLKNFYKAVNNSGYVFDFGDTLLGVDAGGTLINVVVGLDADGNPINDISSPYAQNIKNTLDTVLSTETQIMDISLYSDISSSVKSVDKTESGNYIVMVEARGYDAQSQYSQEKKPIKIKLSATKDGRIISTLTIEQNESRGIGDICASADYYTQYNGKTKENYETVDTVTGATITTTAYRDAIGKALSAIYLIESANAG